MINAFSRRFQLVVDQLAGGNKKQFAEQTESLPLTFIKYVEV